MVVLLLIVVVLAIVAVRLQHSLEALREDVANLRLHARTDAWPTERLEALERRVIELDALQRRVTELEAALSSRPETAPPPPSAVATEPAPVDALPTTEAPSTIERPSVVEMPPVVDIPVAVTTTPAVFASPVVEPPPMAEELPVVEGPRPASQAAPAAPPSHEGWEVIVGTSWLNKIGVVVFVVGLALLLGYSMANVGALGRVAIGYALSVSMLGAGVVLERRETYRNYAYGLIGGGWAGLYFTTYAMHALPAARVVESDLVGALSLVLVAAGMIVHSLRYQSQTVTGLAYVAAYAPLAFSPLSTFSLAATVPLTASLLFVASRFAWSGIAVVGLTSTYGIFVLRTSIVGATPGPLTLHLVLWTYWLLFEIADIASRRRPDAARPAPLFVLNAAGFLGAMLLHTAADESQWLLIGAAAAAYTASALVRAQWTRTAAAAPTDANRTVFTSVHGATALAAALFAFAIDLRFAGSRQTMAWLLETELLVAAGISLADRHIRRIGTAVAALTTLHAAAVLLGDLPPTGFHSVLAASPTALLVATVWYGNREWLRRHALAPEVVEHLYGWVALVFVLQVITREVPGAYRGPAAIAFAALLLEAGLRRATEYRHQSYVALAAAWSLTAATFVLNPLVGSSNEKFDRDVWIALPIVIALAYGFAARVRRQSDAALRPVERVIAAAVAAMIGTGFLAVLEWHVAPRETVGAVWAGTAAVVTAFGASRGGALFRWQGYLFAWAASFVPLAQIALQPELSVRDRVTSALAILFLYVVGYIGRSAAPSTTRLEPVAAGFVAFLGTALQALFVWRVVPADLVAPVWAASAAVLVTLGARRERPWQRWQGYALVLIATMRAAAALTGALPLPRQVLASGAVVLLTYLVGYLGRALRPSANDGDTETLAAGTVSYVASFHLGFLIYEFLPLSRVVPAWVTAGLSLVALGIWRGRQGQRWQGYVFFAASVAWMLLDLASNEPRDTVAALWMGFSVISIYGTAMALRPSLRAAEPGRRVEFEDTIRVGLLVAATVVLSALLIDEVGTRLATLAWALQGATLLVVGFLARERVLRLSGLALLFVCILKLFAYDLRQLEALARILSFVVLGLVLLAVSWVYTRYREQIRKLL